MPYSVDTSYVMRAWTLWYPYEVFPAVWQVIVSMMTSRQVLVIAPVAAELEKQAPDIVDLFDAFVPDWRVVVNGDTALMTAMDRLESDLLGGSGFRNYPEQNIKRYMSVADPVLVLHAKLYDHIVVSNETSDLSTKKGPKIPDLCDREQVRHANPGEFAAALGFTFEHATVAE